MLAFFVNSDLIPNAIEAKVSVRCCLRKNKKYKNVTNCKKIFKTIKVFEKYADNMYILCVRCMKGDCVMSTSINVQVNGQTVTIQSGEKLEDVKKKLANPAEPIFEGVDINSNGKLDAGEIEKLKSNLESNNYTVEVADDGKTPRRAYNDAMQNLRNSYDSDKLGEYFKGDDADLYEVKKGETLYMIAKKQLEAEGLPADDFRAINNRIAQIANLNGINDVNNIKEGTKLKVKLTDEAIKKVKENDNDSAKAFSGVGTAAGDDWTNGARRTRKEQKTGGNAQSNDGVNTDYKKKKTLADGKTSSIKVTPNGLNMGKGVPVDKDGNVLKDFKDPKFQEGGAIMKYTNPNHNPQEMYQITHTAGKAETAFMFKGVKLSAPSIQELNELKAKYKAAASKIKKAPANETAEAKATRVATNLASLKELVTLTGGNEQVIKNVAEKLRDDDYVDRKSDGYKEFVQELLLTRNGDVVSALLPVEKDNEGKEFTNMSVVENDRTAHEYLAGMYQEIREKEKAGEKLTADEIKLKDALVNTRHEDGFKIDADEAKHVNEKWLNYNNNGELYYATYVDDDVYWASDEKLLDEFANKLKAADTDEKKAALFKEYANTSDTELAKCLAQNRYNLNGSDDDVITLFNTHGADILGEFPFGDSATPKVLNAAIERFKEIFNKDKGNLENAVYLKDIHYLINRLPENEQEKARTEIAETYFEKTTTKDEDGNDKVEYTFNPKRRPTKEEMAELCNVASGDMKKALVKYTKLEDMGVGQYNEATESSYGGTNTVPHYGEMVDGMTDKKEVLDFIDNKIATDRNYHVPYDKILEKFPDDKEVKDKLLANIDENSTISDENRLALAKTYLKEENGKVSLDKSKLPKGANAVNVLKALPTDCKTGEAEKYFKAVLKELGKGDLEIITKVGKRNPKAVKARLAELVKANMSDKAFVQEICKLDDSITPYQALYEVDANKAKWDDKTKQAVFEKIFNNRIKIKDKQKYLNGAVKSGLATKIAEDRYIIGSNVYLTSGWNDENQNGKRDDNETLTLQRTLKAGYDNGAKLYGQLKGAGSGDTAKMLKGEGNYKNFVTADNVAGLIQGFNDKSPKEGIMQYIANEWATIPQATCNVIPNKLMEKAKTLNLTDSKEFKELEKFVKSHSDKTKGYSEDEGKQLDALIKALADIVLFKF